LVGVIAWSNSKLADTIPGQTRTISNSQLKLRLRSGPLEFRAARVPGRSSSGPLEFRARLEAIVRAGDPLPKISPHDLRHTAGTLMLMRGVPLETVTDTLGHKDSSITRQTHIHITQKFRRDHVIDLFPALPVRVVQKIAVN
jgi:integrase